MAKRLTQLEKAIQHLDEQIKTLEVAKQHLVEQQRATNATPVKRPQAGTLVVEKIG